MAKSETWRLRRPRSTTKAAYAILAVLRDITERKRAEREMRESREQLRHLSASLQAVREEEKARIARELHDELGQALTGLKMDLAQIVDAARARSSTRPSTRPTP